MAGEEERGAMLTAAPFAFCSTGLADLFWPQRIEESERINK